MGRAEEGAQGDIGRRVDDVVELVDLTDLVDVSVLRLSGEVHESGDAPPVGQTMRVFQHLEADFVEVRCVMEVVTERARFLADVATRYQFKESLEVREGALAEFVARVGVMAAYPFVREAIHQTASRLRVPAPVLGLIKQNQIELTADDAVEHPLVTDTLRQQGR